MRGQDILFSAETGEWRTPLPLFHKLNEEFGFDFDAAANAENCLVPGPNGYVQNALNDGCEWGPATFCNPPYGNGVGRWVSKGHLEASRGSTVVMLLPARTDTRWWHNHVMAADEIRLIPGRVKFWLPDKKLNSAPFPSAVIVWRPFPDLRRGHPRVFAWTYPRG